MTESVAGRLALTMQIAGEEQQKATVITLQSSKAAHRPGNVQI